MYSDLQIAHCTLSFYNLFLVQPFDFDSKNLGLNLIRRKLKKVMFVLATVNAYCVTLYKILAFVQTLLILNSDHAAEVDEVHLSIHFVLLSGYICMMFRCIVIYLVYPEVIVSLFNWCSETARGKRERSAEDKIRAHLFLLLANGQLGINSFFLLLYILTCHNSPQFMQSSVPAEYNSTTVQLVLAFIELHAFMYVNSMGCFVLFIQLLFFARTFDACQCSIVRLR